METIKNTAMLTGAFVGLSGYPAWLCFALFLITLANDIDAIARLIGAVGAYRAQRHTTRSRKLPVSSAMAYPAKELISNLKGTQKTFNRPSKSRSNRPTLRSKA